MGAFGGRQPRGARVWRESRTYAEQPATPSQRRRPDPPAARQRTRPVIRIRACSALQVGRTPRTEEQRMARWTTCTTIDGEPERVLDVLTDPDACRRWAPVDFEVEGRASRLQAGVQTRVAGRMAGREVGFDVRILEADARRLVL